MSDTPPLESAAPPPPALPLAATAAPTSETATPPKKKKKRKKPGSAAAGSASGVRVVGLPGGPVVLTPAQLAQLGIKRPRDAWWLRAILATLLLGVVGLSIVAYKVWFIDPPQSRKAIEWASAIRNQAHEFQVSCDELSVEPLVLRGLEFDPNASESLIDASKRSTLDIQNRMRSAYKAYQQAMSLGAGFLREIPADNEEYSSVQETLRKLHSDYRGFLEMARQIEAVAKKLGLGSGDPTAGANSNPHSEPNSNPVAENAPR